MEESDALRSSLNKIKSIIDEKDQAIWSSEAITKCKNFFYKYFLLKCCLVGFKEATQQLKYENEILMKDIERIRKETEELKPLVKMSEEINEE